MPRMFHRNNKIDSLTPPFVFADWFEERKTLEYLQNTINSPLADFKPFNIFELVVEIFGEPCSITHKLLINNLIEETRHKKAEKEFNGFRAA